MAGFLTIHPSDLRFPFELRKQNSCSLQLTNNTNHCVAFKVKTSNPKNYCVRPNMGIVLPNSAVSTTITMQALKEAPPTGSQCLDKFLIQSVIVPYSATNEDITQEMFNKAEGKVIDEFKLRVAYIPVIPPSPVQLCQNEMDAKMVTGMELPLPWRKSSFPETGRSVVATLAEAKKAAVRRIRKLVAELFKLKMTKTTLSRSGMKDVVDDNVYLGVIRSHDEKQHIYAFGNMVEMGPKGFAFFLQPNQSSSGAATEDARDREIAELKERIARMEHDHQTILDHIHHHRGTGPHGHDPEGGHQF